MEKLPSAHPSFTHRPPDQARYRIIRRLGVGAMGVVFEALDCQTERLVALKTLRHVSPSALYKFKQEFRALADVVHPNLVHLYELGATGNEPFFTMELVRGVDILAYVRSGAGRARANSDEMGARELPPVSSPGADFWRLEQALAQLVAGVSALHAAGKLHRDIKPSNILVTEEGRLVLLDFGVATDLSAVVEKDLTEAELVGTASYMAPEQAAEDTLTAASDWYGVGAVLYEMLVGQPPFVGPAIEVLTKKNVADPPAPKEIVPGLPAHLNVLCMDLLSRAPEMRPTGSQILSRLSGTDFSPSRRPMAVMSPLPAALPASNGLVGRGAHLRTLHAGAEECRRGGSLTVRVHGASGMGKSALIQAFLDELTIRGEAVTLRGRAYEREEVPYKAFDAVIDALSRYLLNLTEAGETFPLPRDVWALTRLFPVLRRVPTLNEVSDEAITDLQQVRSRAFSALRALFTTLSRRRPIVLYIDDVQWGDVDSVSLLLELVRQPKAPPLLILLAYRDDEEAVSPFLVGMKARWPEKATVSDLAVGALSDADAEDLASTLLATAEGLRMEPLEPSEMDDARRAATARAIARESGGSAFLVEELVRSARAAASSRHRSTTPIDWSSISLDQMVRARLARIDGAQRRLLETVAVAGRPLPVTLLGEAATLRENLETTVAMLRARRFVRTGFRDGRETVEMSHDRLRETIVKQLSSTQTRDHHASLARALEASHTGNFEQLAFHLAYAGDPDRAARFAEQAADQATAKLAFDQAVRLYRLAISSTSSDSPHLRRLRTRLAEALEWVGRGAESAEAYFDAAKGAPAIERAELERAAAEQLLMCGHMNEGARALHGVLALWGMSAPRTPLAAVLLLLFYRLRLRLGGLKFEEREPSEVPREERAKLDAMYAVAIGLSIVDVVTSACMQARHLLIALRKGDTFQVMRALSLEASHLSSQGGPETPHERELFAIVQRLAEQGKDSEARQAFFHAKQGIRYFLRGQWKDARRVLDLAYARYPNNRAGSHSNAYLFSLYSLVFLGDFNELAQRQAYLLADAEQRGDRYTTVNLRVGYPNIAWLALDDVPLARRHATDAMEHWPQDGFTVQHWEAMLAEAHIELYAGDGAAAYARVERDAKRLKRSFLLKVQFLRAGTDFARARAAIATIEQAPSLREARLAEATAITARLEKEGMPWTASLASLAAAAVANASQDGAATEAHLRLAIARSEAANMQLFAFAARYRLAHRLGGEEGRALEAETLAWMEAQGIRAPSRMAALFLPGVWRTTSR